MTYDILQNPHTVSTIDDKVKFENFIDQNLIYMGSFEC